MTTQSLKWVLCLFMLPGLCQAWWNDDWHSRRQISVDASVTGADVQETLADFPVLVRLHAGNFGYFMELADNGRDLRFLKDEQTPLHYQIEQLDSSNEMGLVWVRLPQVRGGVSSDDFWMYYGSANAADASDGKALYDVAQGLVYHFKVGENLPQDATAYASHAVDSKAQIQSTGWIGAAAQFNGAGPISINPAPQLAMSADKGWSFSTWIKIDQPQTTANVLSAVDGANRLELSLQGTSLSASANGVRMAPVNLTLGRWQQLSLVLRPENLDLYTSSNSAKNPRSYSPPQILELYVDGVSVGSSRINLSAFNPAITLGDHFNGWMDEVQIAATARSPDWVKLSYRSQSPDFAVLGFGQDESNGSGSDSHFWVIVQNVTMDGWVVIGLTGVMLLVAIWVMIGKALVINRVVQDNRRFLEKYRQLDPRKLGELDVGEPEPEASDLLTALLGKHEHFQRSTLYHLYHLAIHELKLLQGDADQPVAMEAWNFLRVKLDSQIVSESQRLNHNMVLLTIAIAGGPFLGLLGTVMGVMITFAAIAATGDVNINSIAPGIAAALLATVAGLAVAIPSLFAYNYLLTQIKEITAGMRVFSNEFLAVLAMGVARQGGGKLS